MKFVVISDSHGKHKKLVLPEGDVIIHAGDISRRGEPEEVADFLKWFSDLPFEHKIFIAGNHDFFFERNNEEVIQNIIPENVNYLCDSGVTIGKIKVWGSPVTPWFYNWAFNRQRGEQIGRHWDSIPGDTDILITHGPAFSILDKTIHGQCVGCSDLLDKIKEIKPAVHICGHIHEAYGEETAFNTKFINASVNDENYVLKNQPVVFEL